MTSGMDIVNLAKQSLGVNYVWGGNDLKNGVDCSGLVQQVYAKFGIQVPRVTYQQIDSGSAVGMSALRPGDLIFFATESAKDPDHVGIYMGGGKFIHAPHTGDVVKVSDLSNSYYSNRFIGGRRIAGVTGSQEGGDSSPEVVAATAKVERMTGQELAETYGLSLAFFDAVPELKGMLDQAVDGQWSPDRWTAALKNSNWWRENSDTRRQMVQMETSDPATFKAQLGATVESLRSQAVQMGAVISDDQLTSAARMAMVSGWGADQIQGYLGSYINFTENHVLGGQAGAHYRAINTAAQNNGITLGDDAMRNYAAYIGRGLTSLEDVLGQVRQQAAGAFPAFSEQIMSGQTVKDIASPYVQMMARETGRAYTDLDPFTPQVKDALNRRGPDGTASPMSLSEFQQSIRSDPSWRGTQTAINSTMGVAGQVLQAMGLR